ncbi:MAG TPA: SUMF1/EgtB/PvdO family nonheme iron enzyme [Thiolinea sp.]|nr:SUMF1/EgtB/PvdO family nonheme iron enzyme [Thiolinea sp.]
MTDIFISYSNQNRDWVKPLAAALEARGYSVWWDPDILPGQHYQAVIQQALHAAGCVVVVWTPESVASDYVRAECLWAFSKRNLVGVLARDATIPTPFNAVHAADLRRWKGRADDVNFRRLLRGIALLNPRDDIPPPPPPPKPVGSGLKVLAAAMLLAGGAWGGLEIFKSFQEPNSPAVQPATAPVSVPEPVPEPPKAYRLVVEATPADAVVMIDGQPYQAERTWRAGTYRIHAEADGYRPLEDSVTVRAADQTVTVELEPEQLPFEPQMIAIPGGTFTMGCVPERDDVEGGCYDDEKPAHEVTLKPFWLAKTEVTVGQFRAFVDSTGHKTTAEAQGSCRSYDKDGQWSDVKGRSWRKAGFEQTDEHPAVCLSWNDAQAYVNWLSRETGKDYRLPTEAEWEYAARGGAKTAYFWGNKASHEYANYGKDECCDGLASGRDQWVHTSPVGSFPANGFGLQDMNGNVYEWVQDCWQSDYTKTRPDGGARPGCGANAARVLRGGSWHDSPWDLRSAYRNNNFPVYRYNDVGFRAARTN